MKKLVYLISLFVFVTGCQFFKNKPQAKSDSPTNRVVAQAEENNHYHSAKSIETYKALANEPLFITNASGESEENFVAKTHAFVMRQFDSIYIGQFLMYDFDKELDRLVKVKQTKGKLDDADVAAINKIHIQLRIAWIISERNRDELADLYLMTLETRLANETNVNQDQLTKTNLILSQIPKWLHGWWTQNYKSGVIALAQDLTDVNEDFLQRYPQGAKYVIDFSQYNKLSKKQMHLAYSEGKNPKLRYKFEKISRFIEKTAQKQYDEEMKQYESSPDNSMTPLFETEESRKTSALDTLEPNAGGLGHMSGRLVPENSWAMTFDDGPHKTLTEEMFKTLIANKIPATFFMLSQNIKLYPQLVQKMKDLGFYRASHSMTHANLPTLKTAQLETEITGAAEVFTQVIGERPTLFRCPYGACGPMNSEIRQIIAKNNMIHVHWTVDPLDWQDKNPQSIFDRTRKQIELRGKGIILFHDVHPQSVEAVKLLLPYMKSKKFRMLALPKMITEIREKEFYSP